MELKEELLKTLSFYEPMSLEYILLDLDKSFLDTFDELTTQDLLSALEKLKMDSLIKEITNGEEKVWIRMTPKKKLIRRIRDFLKL